jgi:hypothetical protein
MYRSHPNRSSSRRSDPSIDRAAGRRRAPGRSRARRVSSAPSRMLVAPVRHTLPEDTALYRCGCGNAFTAAVTTLVACPTCGQAQAW